MAIIVKNVTASGITIPDLAGLYVTASGQVDLREFFSLDDIHSSESLDTLIENDYLILNDGVQDLNKTDSLEHVAVSTTYEAVNYFKDLRDTPAAYTADKLLKSTASGIAFIDSSSFVVDEFIGLSDTPTTYSGSGSYSLKVSGNTINFVKEDSFITVYSTVTENYTLLNNQTVVFIDAFLNDINITLIPPSAMAGKMVWFKRTDTGSGRRVYINTEDSTYTIENEYNLKLSPLESFTLHSDGNNYWII